MRARDRLRVVARPVCPVRAARAARPAIAAIAAVAAVTVVSPAARADREAVIDDDARPLPHRAVDAVDRQLEIVGRTAYILVDKLGEHRRQLRSRVRSAYKLARQSQGAGWHDAPARSRVLHRRSIVRRVLRRDLAELAVLRDELGASARARLRLQALRARARLDPDIDVPAHGELASPVGGRIVRRFGEHRDAHTGARMLRRGVELAAGAGDPVRAPSAAIVRYAGPIRGADRGVVLERDGDNAAVLVIGGLRAVSVRAGDRVEREGVIGEAAGDVYLEVRLALGPAGLPVDPRPLLR